MGVFSYPHSELATDVLLGLAQGGDSLAFDTLWARLLPGLTRQAFGLAGNPCTVEDLLAETRLRFWEALPRLRRGSDARAWTSRVLANRWRDVVRRRSRRPAELLPDLADLALPLPREEEPEAVVLLRLEPWREPLARALAALRQRHPEQADAVEFRELLELRFVDLPGNAVTWRSRHRRGLRFLAGYLRRHYPQLAPAPPPSPHAGGEGGSRRRAFRR
jgi:DNA-directed RNA polymerase specialized sigma24 family protein